MTERIHPASTPTLAWIETDHPRVFYKELGDKWDRGELEIAKKFAEAFPEHIILITMGPYRAHDIATNYMRKEEGMNVIHIDFYSVRLPSKEHVLASFYEVKAFLKGIEVEKRMMQND